MKKPKVLILTTNYGNGHLQVARALEDQFVKTNNADVAMRDIYQETSPRFHEWTKKLYLKSYTKSGRQLYRLFYYSSQEFSKRKQLKVFSYGYSKLSKIIREERPDAIINTFPTLAVSQFLMKNEVIPTYNVVTDYCLHYSWVSPLIDSYYVATNQLKAQLIAKGIEPEKIAVTGIPVHHTFEQTHCREKLLAKYELKSNLRTILIVAGAFGVSKEIKDICEKLAEDENIQIMIVCGNNKHLYEQLQMKYKEEQHVRVFGYVTEMAELFELATCVVTKPGGIILSEALAKNVPVSLLKATPGQERENALYFKQHGAAITCGKWEQLASKTRELVYNDDKLKQMKASLEAIRVLNSAKLIVNDVLENYYVQESQNRAK